MLYVQNMLVAITVAINLSSDLYAYANRPGLPVRFVLSIFYELILILVLSNGLLAVTLTIHVLGRLSKSMPTSKDTVPDIWSDFVPYSRRINHFLVFV